jgi:16S rRNA (adenine1518-N6/adenine1519-N6)-dimethyltransferase
MQGFVKKKYLGQHFLADKNIARNIADLIEADPGDTIVEIGPGLGALTEFLVAKGRTIIAIEIDSHAAALLEEKRARFGWRNLTIVNEDVLTFNFSALAEQTQSKLHLIGNLPYNISSPILFHIFGQSRAVVSCTFMLQKEVAERIVSGHGSKQYGILSIFTHLHADARIAFRISPSVFRPQPKVWSAVVILTMNPSRLEQITSYDFFRTLVKQVFTMRRKKLSNGLKALGIVSREAPGSVSHFMDLRPEQLSVEDFILLSNTLYASLIQVKD